jgi:hypothetical protein
MDSNSSFIELQTMTTPLSPAAQSIVKAFDDRYELLGPLESDWQEQCIATALRAAANNWRDEIAILAVTELTQAINDCADCLCEIAAELEAQP